MAHLPSDTSSASSGPKPIGHRGLIPPGGTDDEKAIHNGHPVEVTGELRFAGRKINTDEDDEDDMDALIEELESLDPEADIEDDNNEPGSGQSVPEELLQTDTRMGLTEPEVIARRKKYGLNKIEEEKNNLIKKFLMYFKGPIQFVMEVRITFLRDGEDLVVRHLLILSARPLLSLRYLSGTGLTLESSAPCCCSMPPSVLSRNFRPAPLWRSLKRHWP